MPVAASPNGSPWNVAFRDVEHVILDVETTGNDPVKARICEVAWMRRDATGRCLARGESLVRAGAPVGASQAIHGIDDAALANAPALPEIADELARALSGAVLVGHRIAYDLAFLEAAAARGELAAAPPEHALDTKKLAQRVTHGVPTSLGGLAAHFGLVRPAHRAAADVDTTAALFDELVKELAPRTALDLWIAQSIEGAAQMRDDVREIIARAMATRRVVRLRYRVPGRAPIDAELEPWAMEGAHVEGLLAPRGRRVLRGDRILRAELGERVFTPPEALRPSLPTRA